MAVKQRRQIVSMRDRAWGEFSLWDVVCMGITCLVCFCELVFWCFAKCLQLGYTALGKMVLFLVGDILESAKIGRNLGNIKSEKREKPQPIGFSLKLVFKDQPMLKLFLVHLLNPLAFLL